MIAYGIALVPLARRLREEVPGVVQPWYVHGGTIKGTSKSNGPPRKGPARGYFPEPSKSIVLSHEAHEAKARRSLESFHFQYTNRARYLGGFIGTPATRTEWLTPKI